MSKTSSTGSAISPLPKRNNSRKGRDSVEAQELADAPHATLQRLTVALRDLGRETASATHIAEAIGEVPQLISDWSRTGISASEAVHLQAHIGISAVWLMRGQRPILLSDLANDGLGSRDVLSKERLASIFQRIAMDMVDIDALADELADPATTRIQGAMATSVRAIAQRVGMLAEHAHATAAPEMPSIIGLNAGDWLDLCGLSMEAK